MTSCRRGVWTYNKSVIPRTGTYALLGDGKVKIGKSNRDLLKRVRSIQLLSPSPLRLIGTLPHDVETELHHELAPHHLFGEWFEMEPAVKLVRERLDHQDLELLSLVTSVAPSQKTHCVRGHELTPENCYPVGLESGERTCSICSRDRAAEYRAKNPDVQREWARRNRERLREQHARWTEANRERIQSMGRAWRQRNRDAVNARRRARNAARREEVNARAREWRAENREKLRARRAENKEVINERARAYAERNREEIRARARAKRAAARAARQPPLL